MFSRSLSISMLGQVALYVLAVAASQVAAYTFSVDYVENIDNLEGWQGRIVSGWQAYPGQHPHQVSLRMVDFFGLVSGCGGNVVARQWIVTAAHCSAGRVTIVVRAGVVALTRPEIMVETTTFYNHPNFDATTPGAVQPDDIALVKLPIRLQYSRNLRPILIAPLADAHKNYDGIVLHASGFGRTWTDGPSSEVLNWVYLRGVSNPSCASLFGTRVITANTVCARYFNVTSQSICQGDSGGPLVHVKDGVPLLIGVSSFVAGAPFGCHSGIPGGFVRCAPFHRWFTDVTGIDFENLDEEDEDITTEPTTPDVPTTPPTIPDVPTTPPTIPEPTTPPTIPDVPTTPPTIPDVPTTPPTIPDVPTTPPTIPDVPTTPPTIPDPPTTPAPDDDDDEEDPEMSELLKRLEVKVKVLVRFSKGGRNETTRLK